MTTQIPRRPRGAARREQVGVPEVVEFRGVRWPVALVVLLSLLVGLGLGHTVFSGDEHRLRAAEQRISGLTSRLDAASRASAELQARLSARSGQVAGTDDLVNALARLLRAVAVPSGELSGDARVAHARAVRFVDAVGAGRPAASSAFADGAVLTNFVDGRVVRGAEDIARYLAGSPGLSVSRRGEVALVGDYAAARVVVFSPFDEVVAHVRLYGVGGPASLVLRIIGAKVGHAWLTRPQPAGQVRQ